jgi:hypothetical protein
MLQDPRSFFSGSFGQSFCCFGNQRYKGKQKYFNDPNFYQ